MKVNVKAIGYRTKRNKDFGSKEEAKKYIHNLEQWWKRTYRRYGDVLYVRLDVEGEKPVIYHY